MLPELGKRPPEGSLRDAIHLAVYPAMAGRTLQPGQRVEVASDGVATPCAAGWMGIGVVDPFLLDPVLTGQPFWLCLLPGIAGAPRHAWSHPEIPDEAQAKPKADEDGMNLLASLLEAPDMVTLKALADRLEERGEAAAAERLREMDTESFGEEPVRCGC